MDLSRFDEVVIRQPDGTEKTVESRLFAELPLTERVHLVARGLARFLKGGREVPVVEALRRRAT